MRRGRSRYAHVAAWIAIATGCIAWCATVSRTFAAPTEQESDRYRPQFHFAPERTWTNDPNGLVFYEGEYHLFYQNNPFGETWGHMSWGHAVSRDMVHWEHLPIALREADGVMIFSGSAVVDWHNTSGFGRGGKPPLVAIYTGHYMSKSLQNQQIAFSNDRGRTWTKYANNPVLDIGERDFRDPHVFWHEPTHRWLMAVAWPMHRQVRFYASADLKQWTHLSDFGPAGATDGVWECPDFFPLNLDGKEKWVLIVSTSSGAPAGGSGCQYFVGSFDGERFTRDSSDAASANSATSSARPTKPASLWTDDGPDCYAAISWNDVPRSDGRRLWLGWMANGPYAGNTPTHPWRGEMTIPRELNLRLTPEGVRLVQAPVRELQTLRGEGQRLTGNTIVEANAWLKQHVPPAGYPLEISLEFPAATAGTQSIVVLKGENEQTLIGVDRDKGRVFVDRTHSGNVAFSKSFPRVYAASLGEASHRAVRLQVFIDACSIETFVNDGEHVFTTLVFPQEANHTVEVLSAGTKDPVPSLEFWPLRSSWK